MPIASSPTSQLLDVARQSWLLKLVWPWPLSYWSTYAICTAIGFLLVTWHWLRAMHDHYVAEGFNAGRRPFPALRA